MDPTTQTMTPRTPTSAMLRFSPTAWAKLLYLRDLGNTEVGGFGISTANDPLLVENIQLVRQFCTFATVRFDDESVADFFDQQVDAGRRPDQFARLWVHTHPGNCPQPSGTDEETFARVFGRSDWAVMFILAKGGATYARLRFSVGPGADIELNVNLDFTRPFGGCDHEAWQTEYDLNVSELVPQPLTVTRNPGETPDGWERMPTDWRDSWFEYLDDDLAMGRRDEFTY